MISARRGAGTRRHLAKARLAASTAASTSALADFWKMPTTSRVSAGLRSSKVSPVEDSTHSPSMKFFTSRVGLLLPTIAGEARVSVAMMSPYECPSIDATEGVEGAAREHVRSGFCRVASTRFCVRVEDYLSCRHPEA